MNEAQRSERRVDRLVGRRQLLNWRWWVALLPVFASLVYGQGDLLAVISAENPDDWAGKRVRLVVEE